MKPDQPAPSSQPPTGGNHNFQNVKDVASHAKTRMDKVLTDLQHEISTIRTGRASVAIFDNIKVDFYGTPTPINQVANLHVPEPALITIQPWDVSQIPAIEKAIRGAELGLNPGNDGKLIRVPVPPLTEERRKEIVKRLHHVTEDHRVAARNIRRDANEHLKKLFKDKLISEDEERRGLEDVQKMTDGQIVKLDEVSKGKEKEILNIK
jgi:ribosome recycling factor